MTHGLSSHFAQLGELRTGNGPTSSTSRPTVLAERAGMSKQAMHQLLGTRETLGYVVRSPLAKEGGARIVHFTDRGHAAYAKIADILQDIEREWIAELGPKRFAQLKALLGLVWRSPLAR